MDCQEEGAGPEFDQRLKPDRGPDRVGTAEPTPNVTVLPQGVVGNAEPETAFEELPVRLHSGLVQMLFLGRPHEGRQPLQQTRPIRGRHAARELPDPFQETNRCRRLLEVAKDLHAAWTEQANRIVGRFLQHQALRSRRETLLEQSLGQPEPAAVSEEVEPATSRDLVELPDLTFELLEVTASAPAARGATAERERPLRPGHPGQMDGRAGLRVVGIGEEADPGAMELEAWKQLHVRSRNAHVNARLYRRIRALCRFRCRVFAASTLDSRSRPLLRSPARPAVR